MEDTDTDIVVEDAGGVRWITIDRPDDGNMFRTRTCLELVEAFREFRTSPDLGVAVLTGAGDRFFCIGGQKEASDRYDQSVVLPIVDLYELIDVTAKPIIAMVNGFAVGGGNVLHLVCDLSIAAEEAAFRQVGPIVGSFDAGYGTWLLEDAIGRRRAKEMWFLNKKYTAAAALEMGLVNEVVPRAELRARVAEVADALLDRGPQALAALKTAFSSRHTGVAGQARMAHDLLLTQYRHTEESAELQRSFNARTAPDRGRFNR